MAIYRIIGKEIVPEVDFGKITEKMEEIPAQPPMADSLGVTPFVPIGIGKPLTIKIRHVYTGIYPKRRAFGGSKDVAVVSGVKDYSVFAATTRALNFIQRDHTAQKSIKTPSAFVNGTPIIAYFPSLTADCLTLSFELAVDDFPQEFVDKVGIAFRSLAGIPLLLPHAGYLLAAGEIIKLAGNLGNHLFDGKPEFEITEALNFDSPGTIVVNADFRLLTHSNTLHLDYQYDNERGMVHRQTQKAYEGDDPYVVISLDGRENLDLAEFAPTAASASVLKSFFNMGEDVSTPIDTIVEGIRLLSDMRFRNKALEIAKALNRLPADNPERTRLQQQYDALVKNIMNDLFKPA
ncbi:hypothetical protein [Pseudomonas fluorescens]|uniref:hypothetical protein n=1 Tax=Pseudomonas fluorescens TaxID=294 RepID=UPI001249B14D|nr:hypothetical protein [Pseudomonas fluorescens]CAG8866457.1 hypothetical protein PS861_01474 [Pseudomonas fluorescens]